MKVRTVVLSAFVALCFIVVGLNMFRIQVLNYEKYKTAATQIQLRETELSAKRGTI